MPRGLGTEPPQAGNDPRSHSDVRRAETNALRQLGRDPPAAKAWVMGDRTASWGQAITHNGPGSPQDRYNYTTRSLLNDKLLILRRARFCRAGAHRSSTAGGPPSSAVGARFAAGRLGGSHGIQGKERPAPWFCLRVDTKLPAVYAALAGQADRQIARR